MQNSDLDHFHRSRSVARRYIAWVLLVIAIACLRFAAIPSVLRIVLDVDPGPGADRVGGDVAAEPEPTATDAVASSSLRDVRKTSHAPKALGYFPNASAVLDPPSRPSHALNAGLSSTDPGKWSAEPGALDSRLASSYNFSTEIDLVSLTVREDFFVLFNNSALTSWLRHIQNIRSLTFIGPPGDRDLFHQNMRIHYPRLVSSGAYGGVPPIRWVNETHWITTYKNKFRCSYPTACQQLIKLHVFDLREIMGSDYVGDNVMMVDSDTVWSRNVTLAHSDGRITYWESQRTQGEEGCTRMDPVKFTEAMTVGTSLSGTRRPTLTPYKACRRPEYPEATGARHIVHHMLFQSDVMAHLHHVVAERWKTANLWEASVKCRGHDFCNSRMAEYELYFAFVSENYPERVRLEQLRNGVDYMASSAICSADEIRCCEERGVLLKGCHDHRIRLWKRKPTEVGDMCCPKTVMR